MHPTNTKNVESYNLSFEIKNKCNYTFEKRIFQDISQQVNECIPYENFSLHMRQHNEEQWFIVYDILYLKKKSN